MFEFCKEGYNLVFHKINLCFVIFFTTFFVIGCGDYSNNSPQYSIPTFSYVTNTAQIKSATPTCNNAEQNCAYSTPTLQLVEWNNDWIKGVPCKAPCFAGIVPNKSNIDNALTTLNSVPYIINPRVSIVNDENHPVILWEWRTSRSKGAAGYAQYSQKNIIDVITIVVPKNFTLGDIISNYSSPDEVIVRADYDPDGRPYYYIGILLKSFGLYLWADPKLPIAPFPKISPDLPLVRADFFDPSADGLATMLDKTNLKYQYEQYRTSWHGYGSLASYCTHSSCRAVKSNK